VVKNDKLFSMEGNLMEIIWMGITTIATVVISWVAVQSYRLASKINAKDAEFRQQFNDLLRAMAISNMLSAPSLPLSSNLESRVKCFNLWYGDGVVKIFPKKGIFEGYVIDGSDIPDDHDDHFDDD
jgi:hypothetical protein